MKNNQSPEQEEDLLTMMRRWEQESGGGVQEQAAEETARPEPAPEPPPYAAAETLLRELERFESPAPPIPPPQPAKQAMPAPLRPRPPITPPPPPVEEALPPPPAPPPPPVQVPQPAQQVQPAQQAVPPPAWHEPYRNPWAAPPAPMPCPPAPRQDSRAAQAADAWYQAAEPPPRPAQQAMPAQPKKEPQPMKQAQSTQSPRKAQSAQTARNTRNTQNTQGAQNAPKKKKRPVRRFFTTLLVILLLLGAGSYTLIFLVAGKVDSRALLPADARALAAVHSRITVTNILLIGVDSAVSTNTRSDTMLLLSIDRSHSKLKLTSFLRDTWVDMPGGGQDRLNAANSRGGPPMTMRAISGNFQVRVDHYVLLNFSNFKKVIDALGGVDIKIENNEINYICSTTKRGKAIGAENMRRQMEQNGAVHMDGELALIYVRIRKLDDDLHRTERQRKLLESLMRKCKTNPLLWLGLVQNVLPEIETDMNQFALTNLIMGAPLYIQYKVEQHQVPSSGTWDYATRNGASVIVIKPGLLEQNRAGLRSFLEGQ